MHPRLTMRKFFLYNHPAHIPQGIACLLGVKTAFRFIASTLWKMHSFTFVGGLCRCCTRSERKQSGYLGRMVFMLSLATRESEFSTHAFALLRICFILVFRTAPNT